MGSLCSKHKHYNEADTEENAQAAEIERRIAQETKAEKHIRKILLLGSRFASCVVPRLVVIPPPRFQRPDDAEAIEVNFSCHGMPKHRMGAAVGQDCVLLDVNAKATILVWAKMTPNITDIKQPARVASKSGCEGIAAINTIMSVMGINLDTLRPEPCVKG
ncbi:Guanine nucleotide-binding protein alpha-1 subunit, partial [Thalictrum thalictroides]